jgi:hypothetical protein
MRRPTARRLKIMANDGNRNAVLVPLDVLISAADHFEIQITYPGDSFRRHISEENVFKLSTLQ